MFAAQIVHEQNAHGQIVHVQQRHFVPNPPFLPSRPDPCALSRLSALTLPLVLKLSHSNLLGFLSIPTASFFPRDQPTTEPGDRETELSDIDAD